VIERVADFIARLLLALAALLAFLLCFLVCADVIGRVAFNSPVKGTPEIVSLAIVIICFLQAAFAIRSGGMIWVDAVIRRATPRTQRVAEIAGALLGVAFFGLICWGSIEPAVYSWTSNEFEGEGALRVPAWPARFVVVLGTFLAACNYVLIVADRLRLLRSGNPPPAPGASRGAI
jgi:TRAP-type C4-dicarboxylate transport system permease small subunit